jgi:hypothetical protein
MGGGWRRRFVDGAGTRNPVSWTTNDENALRAWDHRQEEGATERRALTPAFEAETVRLCRIGDRRRSLISSRLRWTEWAKRAESHAGSGPREALTSAEREIMPRLRRNEKRAPHGMVRLSTGNGEFNVRRGNGVIRPRRERDGGFSTEELQVYVPRALECSSGITTVRASLVAQILASLSCLVRTVCLWCPASVPSRKASVVGCVGAFARLLASIAERDLFLQDSGGSAR